MSRIPDCILNLLIGFNNGIIIQRTAELESYLIDSTGYRIILKLSSSYEAFPKTIFWMGKTYYVQDVVVRPQIYYPRDIHGIFTNVQSIKRLYLPYSSAIGNGVLARNIKTYPCIELLDLRCCFLIKADLINIFQNFAASLKWLNISGNPALGHGVLAATIGAFPNLHKTKIEYINLDSCGLNGDDFRNIIQKFSKSLRGLDLSRNTSLRGILETEIFKLSGINQYLLEYLNLSYCRLTRKDIQTVMSNFFPNLKSLNIGLNSELMTGIVTDKLTRDKKVRLLELNLEACMLVGEDLRQVFQSCCHLERLNIASNTQLGGGVTGNVIKEIPVCSKIYDLNIYNCFLNHEDIKNIMLKLAKNLKRIDFGMNCDIGNGLFAEVLQTLPFKKIPLEQLRMVNCMLNANDFKYILLILSDRLKYLDLGENIMLGGGNMALILNQTCIGNISHLKILMFAFCNLNCEDLEYIFIKFGKYITCLDIKNNLTLGNGQLTKMLCRISKQYCQLDDIDLTGCDLNSQDERSVAHKFGNVLWHLDPQDNKWKSFNHFEYLQNNTLSIVNIPKSCCIIL